MKRKNLLKLVGAIVLALVISIAFLPGCAKEAPAPAAEEPIVIRFAEFGPPVGAQADCVKAMVDEIEKRTDGRVKFELYWGATLLDGKEMLKGVMTGVTDMGFIIPTYFPSQIHINDLLDLMPGGPRDPRNVAWVNKKVREEIPAFDEEMARWNQKTIAMVVMSGQGVWGTCPLTCLDDFKDKRIRGSNQQTLAKIETTGAVPVSLAFSECYSGLERGTIDAVMSGFAGCIPRSFHEVSTHILTCEGIWIGLGKLYTINLDTWNSLPEDIQQIMLDVGSTCTDCVTEARVTSWNADIETARAAGCTVNALSDADTEKWLELMAPSVQKYLDQWVKEANEEGYNGDTIMKQAAKIIAEGVARD